MAITQDVILNTQEAIRNLKKLEKQFKGNREATERGSKGLKKYAGLIKGVAAAFLAVKAMQLFIKGLRETVRLFQGGFDEGVKFAKTLAEIETLMDPAERNTKRLNLALLEMSDRFGQDAQNQARGFYDVVSAGVQGFENQLSVLNTTNKVAIAGITDTATATNVLVGTMNAFAKNGETAESVADVLFTTVRRGITTIPQLASVMGQINAKAANTGVSLKEVGAAMAAMTADGIPTAQAATGLRGAIAGFSKPTKEASILIKKLGIDFSVSAIQSKGFFNVLKQIRDATGGNTEQLIKLFPNQRAQLAILPLLGKGWEAFNKQMKNFEDTSGAADKAFERITKTASFQLDRLKVGFDNLFIRVAALIEQNAGTYFKVLNEQFLESGTLQRVVALGFQFINLVIASTIQAILWVRTGFLGVYAAGIKLASFFNKDLKPAAENATKAFWDSYDAIFEVEQAYEDAHKTINEFYKGIGKGGKETKKIIQAHKALAKVLNDENQATAAGNKEKTVREEKTASFLDLLGKSAGFQADLTKQEITDSKGRNLEKIKEIKDEEKRTKALNDYDKQKVKFQTDAANQIGALAKGAFGEYKAFQIAEATISTYAAANKALAAYPPPWSFAAAAAAVALGLANVAKISGLAFQQGGIVPGNQFEGDRVIARVNSGEMVLNRGQQKALFDSINSGNLSGGSSNITVNIQSPTGDIPRRTLDKMIDQIRERVQFGNKRFV